MFICIFVLRASARPQYINNTSGYSSLSPIHFFLCIKSIFFLNTIWFLFNSQSVFQIHWVDYLSWQDKSYSFYDTEKSLKIDVSFCIFHSVPLNIKNCLLIVKTSSQEERHNVRKTWVWEIAQLPLPTILIFLKFIRQIIKQIHWA